MGGDVAGGPTVWHAGQVLQWFSASESRGGHHTLARRRDFVFVIPWCFSCMGEVQDLAPEGRRDNNAGASKNDPPYRCQLVADILVRLWSRQPVF